MKKITFLLAAFAFFIACTKDSDELVKVGPDASLTPRTTKEFKASFQSSLNLNNPFTVCTGDVPGFGVPDHFLAGWAKHFGPLNGSESTLHHDACNIVVADATLTATVSGQITAANGDKIYYSGVDVVDITGFIYNNSETGAINGTWNINGGTGKFEDASGSFTVTGEVNFAAGTFNAEANGTINY